MRVTIQAAGHRPCPRSAAADLPTWPHARSWGYGPSGLAGVVVLVVVVMLVMGRL